MLGELRQGKELTTSNESYVAKDGIHPTRYSLTIITTIGNNFNFDFILNSKVKKNVKPLFEHYGSFSYKVSVYQQN